MKSRVLFSHRARRIFVWLHLWLGLGLGAWFAVIGITGSVLAWRGELSGWELSQRYPLDDHPDGTAMIPLSHAVTAMKRAHPDVPARSLATVALPSSRMPFYSFTLGRNRATMRNVLVDPYSGRVHPPVRMRELTVGTINQLHSRLIAGMRGYLVNGALTALALPLLLSGLWLWWPTKLQHLRARLTIKRGVSLKRTLYDLHNVTGIYSYLILFATTLTGVLLVGNHVAEDGIVAMWNQPAAPSALRGEGREANAPNARNGEGERGARREGGRGEREGQGARTEVRGGPAEGRREPATPTVVPQGRLPGVDEMLAVARGLRPALELTRVKLPQRPDQALEATYLLPVGIERNETVFIDPYAQRELEVAGVAGQNPNNSAYRQWTRALHFGEFGGVFTKVLYTVAGIAPLGLFVSGLWLWLRKKRRRTAHAKVEEPELMLSNA